MTIALKKQGCIVLSIVTLTVLILAPLALVRAHDGEDHSGDAKKEAYVMSTTEMQHMITLLRQVIALMVAEKKLRATPVTHAHAAAVESNHHDEAEEESETLHHEDTPKAVEEKKLIIEVEDHMGKTHVHIRYTDKAEDMYFADAKMSDEAGLIQSIKTRSGLAEEAIKAALKYL